MMISLGQSRMRHSLRKALDVMKFLFSSTHSFVWIPESNEEIPYLLGCSPGWAIMQQPDFLE